MALKLYVKGLSSEYEADRQKGIYYSNFNVLWLLVGKEKRGKKKNIRENEPGTTT